MKKIKIIEIINIVLIIIVILLCIVYLIFTFFVKKDTENKVENITTKFNYIVYERDTEVYKKEFENLKIILNEEQINYEDYANSISKLFILDFYTLSNKKSNQDIGGIQFIEKTFKDNFILNISNNMYKYIKQIKDLPKVKEAFVTKIEETKYKYKDKTYDAYSIKLNWDYETDYGYEKEGTLILIKDKDQLFIVEKK